MVRIPRRRPKRCRHPFFRTLVKPARRREAPAYELIRRLALSHELLCREVDAVRRAVRVVIERTGGWDDVLRERDRLDDLDDRLSGVDEDLRRCKGV
jgi:hypothetical protein